MLETSRHVSNLMDVRKLNPVHTKKDMKVLLKSEKETSLTDTSRD